MKKCGINSIKDSLIVFPYNKVEAGFWSASNEVETVKINENIETINSIILKQLNKTKIGIPTPLKEDYKNKIAYYNKVGFKTWNAFFKKSNFYSISLSFDEGKYTIMISEKSVKYKYAFDEGSREIKNIIFNEDESDKIACIIIDIIKKGMEK